MNTSVTLPLRGNADTIRLGLVLLNTWPAATRYLEPRSGRQELRCESSQDNRARAAALAAVLRRQSEARG